MDARVDKVHATLMAEGFTDVQMPGEPKTRQGRYAAAAESRIVAARSTNCRRKPSRPVSPLSVSDLPLNHNSA